MWQKFLLKLAGNQLYQKIKFWLVELGLTNLLYLTIGVGIWLIPLGPLSVLKSEISVGALSIFIYVNWNIIRKLWKAKVEDKTDEIDKIEAKLNK